MRMRASYQVHHNDIVSSAGQTIVLIGGRNPGHLRAFYSPALLPVEASSPVQVVCLFNMPGSWDHPVFRESRTACSTSCFEAWNPRIQRSCSKCTASLATPKLTEPLTATRKLPKLNLVTHQAAIITIQRSSYCPI